MNKILNTIGKIAVWLGIAYLVLGFIVIPIIAPFVIQWQVSKILKHPVKVQSVFLNPIMFSLSVNGLKILDQHKEPMIAFKHFGVDISFIKLVQQEIDIESVRLDGLVVNTVLTAAGKINLLDLVPAAPATSQVASSSKPMPASAKPLAVRVREIVLNNLAINFNDQMLTPQVKTSVHDVDVTIKNFSTVPQEVMTVDLKAKIDAKGLMEAQAQLKPMAQPLMLETSYHLNDYALTALSPYVGKYTGRALADGKFNLGMEYYIEDNQLRATHKILIQHFTFGEKVESKDALHLPFGLAIALLEDPQGRINITLPVTGDLKDPKFEYFHLIGQVVRNFFIKLVTKPFTFIASMIAGNDSGSDELGYVKFTPGQTLVATQEVAKLATLVKGLKERPKLTLVIDGAYDPVVDWKAIKEAILNKDYSVLRADSTRKERWVYETLYQRRFGVRSLWAVTKKFKVQKETYQDTQLIEELRRQLIEDAPADKIALDGLAQLRAKAVYDTLINLGFDKGRLTLGQPKSVQASMGSIKQEFTLTVYGEDKQEKEDAK